MKRLAAAAVCLVAIASAPAQETVPVPGSSNKFPTTLSLPVNGKPANLRLTGVALRTRTFFSIYALGSYVAADAPVASADQLIAADAPKMLYMVLERDLSSKTILDALQSAMAQQGVGDKFAGEFAQLDAAFGDAAAKKGDHFSLFYQGGGALKVQLVNKVELTVQNAEFAQAVWRIYVGANPLSDGIKAGLLARIEK